MTKYISMLSLLVCVFFIISCNNSVSSPVEEDGITIYYKNDFDKSKKRISWFKESDTKK